MKSVHPESQTVAFAKSRLAIMAAGADSKHQWWSSEFLKPLSTQFLQPVFKQTAVLAQVSGASAAVSRLHDASVGLGGYHLFRLPMSIESSIHRYFKSTELNLEPSYQDSIQIIASYAEEGGSFQAGAVNVGSIEDVQAGSAITKFCSAYLWAFQTNTQVYPFLRVT